MRMRTSGTHSPFHVGPLHIGTSGWSYPQWKHGFYGATLQRDWLAHYAAHFGSVEINTSFYRLPSQSMLESWYRTTPPGFRFAVKAWQKITHDLKLKDVETDTRFFLERMLELKEKLACVLFQLPPSLVCDNGLLKIFLETLPHNLAIAIEFRHASWNTAETDRLLKMHNIARCCSLTGLAPLELKATADWAYLRFHGPERYKGHYDTAYLQACADWLRTERFRSIHAYFNNTIGSLSALENARELKLLLGGWNAKSFKAFFSPRPEKEREAQPQIPDLLI